MTWATRRQVFFFFVFFIIILILSVGIYFTYFNEPPTCFDGLQNSTETGIDCGGGCSLACPAEVEKISLTWARAFEVLPTRYNAVAYLENKNEYTVIRRINYSFRFSDENNVFLGKREGTTYVPPAGKFAIFEPGINLGENVPVYTTFEFTSLPVWEKVSPEMVDQLYVSAGDINMVDVATAPKMFANIRNHSLYRIPELSAVAILYDQAGNAISASRTYVDVLQPEAVVPISFTWPQSFGQNPVVKEIIPMYDISSVKLK